MGIEEYCDILNLEIEITYYPNQGGRWCASFRGVETKEDRHSAMLCLTYGNGKTPMAALADYIQRIRGKVLVINATGGDKRREYDVPRTLQATALARAEA